MKRPVVVAVVATVLAVLATGGLALALWDDDDRWGPGMMSTSGRDRGPMGGPMHGGMHGGGMHGSVVRSEYAFLAEMVAHHEEAIESAGELTRSDRPQMRELGRGIVATQTAEVEQMRKWLEQWYPDESGAADPEPMMRDLTGLSGDRLDEAFLEDMIGHHMAAVMMSQQLLARGLADHPEVATLARSIRTGQHAEMVTMRRWLWQWFG